MHPGNGQKLLSLRHLGREQCSTPRTRKWQLQRPMFNSKNKESCPRTGDIDEGRQGAPQEIGVHKRFNNICGQDFQMDDAMPQGLTSDHLWMERGT